MAPLPPFATCRLTSIRPSSLGAAAAEQSALSNPPPARLVTPVEDYSHIEGAKQLGRYVALKYPAGVVRGGGRVI